MSIAAQTIGKNVKLDGKTYGLVGANNKNVNCVSLRSVATGLFLRHKMGRLVETDPNDNPNAFPADSSFIPEARGDGFVLRCSNKGMEDNYICKIDTDTFIVNPDLVEYLFKAIPAPTASATPVSKAPAPIPGNMGAGSGFLGRSLNLHGIKYLTVPANDDDPGHVSLLNVANGLYARHFRNNIVESGPEMNPQFFALDSSFKPEARGNGLILRCVNQGMETRAIVMGEGENPQAVIGKAESAQVFTSGSAAWPWSAVKILVANAAQTEKLFAAEQARKATEALWGRSLNMDGQSYLTVPANDGDPGHISLINTVTGLYARHFGGKIVESGPEQNAEFFAVDSSFKPEPKDNGTILRCVNKGMETKAIVKGEGESAKASIGDDAAALVFATDGAGWPGEVFKSLAASMARTASLLESMVSKNKTDNSKKK